MRISDWSSDVCSSDLLQLRRCNRRHHAFHARYRAGRRNLDEQCWRTLATDWHRRSEEHTSELQSLMRISYAVFCLKKKKPRLKITTYPQTKNTKRYTTYPKSNIIQPTSLCKTL